MGDGGIYWKTKKQTSFALSSVEAEYMAMCQAAKEAIWLTGLLEDFGIDLQSPIVIFGDSQGAIALAQNPVFYPQSNITLHVNWFNMVGLQSNIFQPGS